MTTHHFDTFREIQICPDDSNILNLGETADFLRISRPTLLELAKRKQIPARQVGVQWRFHKQALLDWLSGNDRVSRTGRKT